MQPCLLELHAISLIALARAMVMIMTMFMTVISSGRCIVGVWYDV